jgi:hypothetical protein
MILCVCSGDHGRAQVTTKEALASEKARHHCLRFPPYLGQGECVAFSFYFRSTFVLLEKYDGFYGRFLFVKIPVLPRIRRGYKSSTGTQSPMQKQKQQNCKITQ